MTELTASLVLKLQDELSSGLMKVQEELEELVGIADKLQLNGLAQATEQAAGLNSELSRTPSLLSRIGDLAKSVGHGFEGIGSAARNSLGRVSEQVKDFGGRIRGFQEASSNLVNRGFGAAAEGFAVYEPMEKYAGYENIVRHIGITEGLSGAALDARIAKLQEFFRTDALHTGQSSESVAQAYQDLTQMGIRADLDTIIQAHSRAATAYNTTAEALGPAVGALIQTMKIPAAELGSAMGAMAQASKEGRFKIEDFSRELPGTAAAMAAWGMTGRKAADTTFAALETVMRGASNPSQAATDLNQLLHYFASPFADRAFKKVGMNLHEIREKGTHSGDLLGTLLDAFQVKTKGQDMAQFIETFGAAIHSHEAAGALRTLLQQRGDFEAMRKQLDQVNGATVERDFQSAFAAPAVQMRIMTENLEQLTERLGQGFLPVLGKINDALGKMNELLKAASEQFPKTTSWVLSGFAGLLALGAALGLIGAILPLIWKGFLILTSPVTLFLGLVAALAAEAYDIYANWGRFRPFFIEMWEGVKEIFQGFLTFVTGFFTGNLLKAQSGVIAFGQGLAKLFTGYFGAVKQVFIDFAHWVDGWASGLGTRILNGIASGWSSLVSGVHGLVGKLSAQFDNSMLGRLLGLAQAKTAPPAAAANDNTGPAGSAASGRVDVHLHAEPGTQVTAARGSGAVNVQTPISAPSRGATVGRP